MNTAIKSGVEDPVAYYLVGASLQLLFPNIKIVKSGFCGPTDLGGDLSGFHINTSFVHVAAQPSYVQWKSYLHKGTYDYLLVLDRVLLGTQQIATTYVLGSKVTVMSIESFIAQHIGVITEYNRNRSCEAFRALLDEYNKSVYELEVNKNLIISHYLTGASKKCNFNLMSVNALRRFQNSR